ncbi:unnamed protein product [Ascophyllum nodosum]
MYWFLQEFFSSHPEYAATSFFVFGESYGGHYAPAVAHRVWQGNNQGEAGKINLTGMGIGNGLTSPFVQYPFYPEMAVNNPYGVKAVSDDEAKLMRAFTPPCVAMIEACQEVSEVCDDAQTFCDLHLTLPYYLSGLNPYDIRYENLPRFLRLDSTRKALNVRDDGALPVESCNMKVNADFSGDWMKTSTVS